MSKNISIQEGGTAKQLTVDKLKTNLVGGGTCLWVPEDIVTLGTKTITENGTYKASDENLYGYSQVTVSGIGKAIGKGADGNEHIVTSDENGNLVDSVLPSSIVVTSTPSRLDYYEGQTIIYDGLVVKAYKNDGSLWTDDTHPDGIIPISELTLPLEKAVITGDYRSIWGNPEGTINALEVVTNERGGWGWSPYYAYYGGDIGVDNNGRQEGLCSLQDQGQHFLITKYNSGIHIMALDNGTRVTTAVVGNEGWVFISGHIFDVPKNKFSGRLVTPGQFNFNHTPVSTIDPTDVEDIDLDAKHSEEHVPVQWECFGVARLETSFDIDVEAWPYDTPVE